MLRIVAETDLSNCVNGKRYNKSIRVIEEFGMYSVLSIERKLGWFGSYNVEVVDTFFKYDHAIKCYMEHGGLMQGRYEYEY